MCNCPLFSPPGLTCAERVAHGNAARRGQATSRRCCRGIARTGEQASERALSARPGHLRDQPEDELVDLRRGLVKTAVEVNRDRR
jgi:hypothetical protein